MAKTTAEKFAAGSSSITDWSFREKHVQPNVDAGGSFIRGSSVLVAAGPPSLTQANATFGNQLGAAYTSINESKLLDSYPIGLIDNVGIGQNKGIQQIFEIGSDRRYFIPGRTINQVSLSRVMFDGPSLMKVIYNNYISPDTPYRDPNSLIESGSNDGYETDIRSQPGFDDTFLNLGSELFNRPIGLFLLMHDNNDDPVAGIYLEYCFIRAHQFNISASSTLIAESLQADFDRMVPIDMNRSALKGAL